jgi:hypothetical protein
MGASTTDRRTVVAAPGGVTHLVWRGLNIWKKQLRP